MADKPIDIKKPVFLRDGTPCRILGTLETLEKRLVVAVKGSDGRETLATRDLYGKSTQSSANPELDVINVPKGLQYTVFPDWCRKNRIALIVCAFIGRRFCNGRYYFRVK